jgi:hypothetical protein
MTEPSETGLPGRREYAYADAQGRACDEAEAVAYSWVGYDDEGRVVSSGSGVMDRG